MVQFLRLAIYVLIINAGVCQACVENSDGKIASYELGPDSISQKEVPKGVVTKIPSWRSKFYPGTIRDWWIYVPAQYKKEKPAAIAFFQDGGYESFDNPNYAVEVFDNLIHAKKMPVTIGVFIGPGRLDNGKTKATDNRSFEYDSLNDTYARFLIEEIFPEVEKKYNVSKSAEHHAIIGHSSGGICAFNAAWERPDFFSKVVSHNGSFTNIRGGHIYPHRVRDTKNPERDKEYSSASGIKKLSLRRKLRVFLQVGTNDLDNEAGNWYLANLQMAAALKFSSWDHKFIVGNGNHKEHHANSIFPDTMRWLWRDVAVE